MNIEIEEKYYEQVANEIQTGQIMQGVWLKAIVEADGNEQKAKALYAKLRIAQLMREHESREIEAAQKVKAEQLQKRKELAEFLKSKKCTFVKSNNGGYILHEPNGDCKPFFDIDKLYDYVQKYW